MDTFPIFPGKNLFPKDSLFKKYLSFCKSLVDSIQHSSMPNSEVYMSFYPIAKNIRFLSSFMTLNLLNNKKSVISHHARQGEPSFWQGNTSDNWYPWLWARGRVSEPYSNDQGWAYYFTSFGQSHKKMLTHEVEMIPPPQEYIVFFLNLACLLYTFQLTHSYMNQMELYKKQMNWPNKWSPTQSRIVAAQIRRGETCTPTGSLVHDRPFIQLETYLEAIDEILESDDSFTHVYISTDSNEEIDRIKQLRPTWSLLYLPIDRTQFFRMEEKAVDLEHFCVRNQERIPFIVDSALADLYFISQCHAFVATLTISDFARCGFFLQMATQERVTPYSNINGEAYDFRIKDRLLLT